jgi:hypothetical protein
MTKFLSLAIICSVFAFASESSRPTLNPDQAQRLVLAALTTQQQSLPGVATEPYNDPHSSRFMFFTVIWAARPQQSVVVGNYAVDPYTGDVWSASAACDELSNPKLRALQRTFRDALRLSQFEYRRLKTKGPLCD